jgi:hypothetical protein
LSDVLRGPRTGGEGADRSKMFSYVRYSPYDGGGGVVDPGEFERRLEKQLGRSQRRAFRRRRRKMRLGAAGILVGLVLLVLVLGFVAFLLVR